MEAVAAQYSAEDMERVSARVAALVEGLKSVAKEAENLTAALSSYKAASIPDQWAEKWGETICKKYAAKMLGISVTYLNKLIDQGKIKTTPDGHVIVRQACEWAHSKQDKRKQAKPSHMRIDP
jgi:hypothetical protein